MLAKTQEKLSEHVVISIATAVGTIVITLLFRNASAESNSILQSIAQPLVGVLLIGIMWAVSKFQSRRYKPGLTLQPQGLVRPEGYHLSMGQVLVYGTLLLIAETYLLAFIAGLLLGITMPSSGTDPDTDQLLGALLPALIFGQSITTYLVSRWIGSRAARVGLLAVVVIVVVGRVLIAIIDRMLGFDVVINAWFVAGFILFTLLIGVVGGIGYWRGVKAREAGYIWYLLSNLPASSREAIESLLYEEVQARVASEAAAAA